MKRERVTDITVLVCTYNRAADLRDLLETALVQETDGTFTYEVLVVDNNSSDDTREVVKDFINRGHSNLRYLFEGRQGKSNALISGLKAARGRLYVITDDDFILPSDWLRNIVQAFHVHPDVSCVGGKVLPLWQSEPPAWLTPRHWSAVAVTDYGDAEFYAQASNQICLLACAFRLADVQAVGGYNRELGVTKGKIGGTEDLDVLKRLWQSGRKGLYIPTISFLHKVTPERMTKAYHRRWHDGHGRFYALMRDEEFERSSARLFDVPVHLYGQAVVSTLKLLKNTLTGNETEAFACETELRFFAGFFRQRRADHLAGDERGTFREVASFARSFIAGRVKRRQPSSPETPQPSLPKTPLRSDQER